MDFMDAIFFSDKSTIVSIKNYRVFSFVFITFYISLKRTNEKDTQLFCDFYFDNNTFIHKKLFSQ